MRPQDVFTTQLTFNAFVVAKNVADVSHEESLFLPRPAGNCLNWILGHILWTRTSWMRSLGLDLPTKDRGGIYDRGAERLTDPGAAAPFDELVSEYQSSQELLLRAVGAMSDEMLSQPAPFSPGNDPDETWGSLTATLCFHEAYHAGQTGVLRRLIGKPGAIT